jgi:16S rRNA (uracil1498-N3)-methyltransferase
VLRAGAGCDNLRVPHRFFAPALDPGDETTLLPREEAEHLTRVLRLGVGDTVSVFDGRGHEFLARVASADRRDVRVAIVSRVEPAIEPAVAITLVQAVLKADKMDDVVRDAVMMGVAAIQPIVTRRTEVTVAALLRGARVDRWKRIALASVKQSRRAVVPEIRVPLTIDTFLDEPMPELALMLVEPGAAAGGGAGGSCVEPVADAAVNVEPVSVLRAASVPHDAAVLVGPEGGWDAPECCAAAYRGIRLITLGHRTLRADAAAVAAISVLQFLWGDL